MSTKRSSWKMERASVHRQGSTRSRSNKFSGGDTKEPPAPHSRSKVWVGGYTRKDGIHVEGHFRATPGHTR